MNAITEQMPETVFTTRVIDLATALGWLVTHSRPARKADGGWSTPIQGHKGFPDLTLVRPPFTIYAELKTEKGTLTPEQKVWIEALEKCGADVRLWRPSDQAEIEATLS